MKYGSKSVNSAENQNKLALKGFFIDYKYLMMVRNFKNLIIIFINQIYFIQKRLRQKVETITSKVDVIRTKWDKCLSEWLRLSVTLKDEGM